MELMTTIIVFLSGVFGLLTSFWWMLLPIGVAFIPDGRHVKWLVAAGFAFYGALMIYGVFGEAIDSFLGGTPRSRSVQSDNLLSLPAWLLSSSIYIVVGLHRWVKASEDENAPSA